MKALIEKVHAETLRILTENREGFEAVAKALVEKEMVLAEDLEQILGPKAGKHGEERFKATEVETVEETTGEKAEEPEKTEPVSE